MNQSIKPQCATDAYLTALGRAVLEFARLEMTALCCLERLQPGSILWARGETTGGVGKRLYNQARRSFKAAYRAEFVAAAVEFKILVERRNRLIHASPELGLEGNHILSYDWLPCTIDALEEVTCKFMTCSQKLNDLLHGPLSHVGT